MVKLRISVRRIITYRAGSPYKQNRQMSGALESLDFKWKGVYKMAVKGVVGQGGVGERLGVVGPEPPNCLGPRGMGIRP